MLTRISPDCVPANSLESQTARASMDRSFLNLWNKVGKGQSCPLTTAMSPDQTIEDLKCPYRSLVTWPQNDPVGLRINTISTYAAVTALGIISRSSF